MVKDLIVQSETIENLEENIDSKISNIAHANIYMIYLPRQGKQKKKNKQMILHQTKKLLHSKKKPKTK